jgi:phage minor structural protein|nr:MAG TPA: tail protein [Caudoviricetes sp.]
MTPILHEADVTSIGNYGLGALKDALSCTVSCEENGAYDLTLIYPMTGLHAELLAERRLISAAPSRYENRQLFRIYRMTRPIDGKIQAYAHHISYDLNNCIVKPFTAASLSEAITKLKAGIVGDCPFDISASYDTAGTFSVSKPMTVRAALLSSNSDNLASAYDGVWTFDGLSCVLRKKETVDRGVKIAYGLNLLDVNQEKNIEDVYTHVYPFWMNSEKNKYYDLEPIAASSITGYRKIYPLDLTSYYQKAPSDASMKKTADEFIQKNEIGKISVSLTVSYVQLEKCVEYTGSGQSGIILRGDTVEVRYLRLGVSATARITKTDYNALLERYDSLQVGDAKERLARTTIRERSRVTTTNDRAVDAGTLATDATEAAERASHVATDYIEESDTGSINFGVGDYSYIINPDGLEFRGVRNSSVIWDNSANASGGLDGNVFVPMDLASYAVVAVGFIDNLGSIFDSSVIDNNSIQWAIAPVNGKSVRATYTWDYPRIREFSVSKTGVQFGPGGWLESKKVSGIPVGVTMNKNKKCCIPYVVMGFL